MVATCSRITQPCESFLIVPIPSPGIAVEVMRFLEAMDVCEPGTMRYVERDMPAVVVPPAVVPQRDWYSYIVDGTVGAAMFFVGIVGGFMWGAGLLAAIRSLWQAVAWVGL